MMERFNPIPYARVRGYHGGQGLDMRAEPLATTGTGALIPAQAGPGAWQAGFEWDEPRDIAGVRVTLEGDVPVRRWRVEYWRRAWPRQPESYRLGASAGWFPTDDFYHGEWQEAMGERCQEGRELSIIFDPMDVVELKSEEPKIVERFFQSADLSAEFRRTLKLRIVMEAEEAPVMRKVTLIGAAQVTRAACRIYACATGHPEAPGEGRVSLWNGELLEGGSFQADECAMVRYTCNDADACDGDQTLLCVELNGTPAFSVKAKDIEGGVYLPENDLLLVPESWNDAPAAIVERLTAGKESIYDRVAKHEEQTLENAFKAIPEMDVTKQTPYGRFVILGWEGVRQKFCLRYNGDIFADKMRQKVRRRDCAKIRWAGGSLHFRVGSGDPMDYGEAKGARRQSMPDASVPVYVTEWIDRRVQYTQTTFAMPMAMPEGYARGDEDILVFSRFRLRNASNCERVATLAINLHPQEAIAVRDGRLTAEGRVQLEDAASLAWGVRPYAKPLLRAVVDIRGQGALHCVPSGAKGLTNGMLYDTDFYNFYDGYHGRDQAPDTIPNTLVYRVRLAAGQSVEIDMKIPYPTYTEEADFRRIEALDMDAARAVVENYWHAFAAAGASVTLPEDARLNDFIRAVPWHIRMTADREVESGFYVVPAGTYLYGACGNEACMQINLLDMLGYHEVAERYLESFVDSQGRRSMDGLFGSKKGALVVNDYDNDMMFAYNLDHGYILQEFAQHYLLTGNRAWLEHVAQTIVEGCDFIIRERASTMAVTDNGEPAPYSGLLPPGRLEDNAEWRYWVAVNAHACAGMWDGAQVLKEIDHPRALDIEREAVAYRQDLLRAVDRATARSAVVPDGKGGYMPHIPTQMEIRGRDWGWFREAAYGPLHLAERGVLSADDPRVTLILRDLEDNLFLSRTWGRNIDVDEHWFDQGGITIQSNLLFNDLTYLKRDQPEYAVRALMNSFAQNLFRDVNCFTEHPIPEFGFGVGPFFKTPDESQFLINLRYHLLREAGDELHLLQGAARAWLAGGKEIVFKRLASAFGPVSLRVSMAADGASAEVTLEGDWRRQPEVILSLRHGSAWTIREADVRGARLLETGKDRLRLSGVEGRVTVRVGFEAP